MERISTSNKEVIKTKLHKMYAKNVNNAFLVK